MVRADASLSIEQHRVPAQADFPSRGTFKGLQRPESPPPSPPRQPQPQVPAASQGPTSTQPQLPPASDGHASTLLTGSTGTLPQADVQVVHGERAVYRAHVTAGPANAADRIPHSDVAKGPYSPSPESSLLFRTQEASQSSQPPSLLPSISHAADTPSHSSDLMSPTLPCVPSYSRTSL